MADRVQNKDAETIVCRCEDVSRDKILECIHGGCRTLDEVKRYTRAGMGPCQGRTCRQLIANELSRAHGIPPGDVLQTTYRPTVKPISLGALADAFKESNIPGEYE